MSAPAEASFTRSTLTLTSGVLVWWVHFITIYGFNGIVCARSLYGKSWLGIGMVTWAIGLATLVALAVLGWILQRRVQARAPLSLPDWLTLAIGSLASVAIAWEGLTVLFVPPCG